MTSIFIVRAEDRGAPESIIYGVYPTAKLALARIAVLEGEGLQELERLLDLGGDSGCLAKAGLER